MFIEKHGLDAFVWNPYEEEHVPAKWKVHFVTDSWFGGKRQQVNMWQHMKDQVGKKTDVKFLDELRNPPAKNDLLFDTEMEAIEKCIELNKLLLQEMEIKMIAQRGQRMTLISEPYGI